MISHNSPDFLENIRLNFRSEIAEKKNPQIESRFLSHS